MRALRRDRVFDALGQFDKWRVVTTSYAYDQNGNLLSSGNGSATTTYTYDYANRLIALFAGGATSTYASDDLSDEDKTIGVQTLMLASNY